MKILHVVHGYQPSVGGSQWLIQNLSEQLVSRYRDEVTVFTTVAYNMGHFWGEPGPVMPASIEKINGVIVRRFPVFNRLSVLRLVLAGLTTRLNLPYNDWFRTLYNGPIIFNLQKAIAQSGAEVILACAFPLRHMYDTLAAARQARIPIVLLGAIHAEDRWGYERKMMFQAIQQADAYIALTAFERDFLIGRGIKPQKLFVIGGGVNNQLFQEADGGDFRARYGWGDSPVITSIGKYVARKRFDILLAAMPHVWAVYPETKLVIAGAKGPFFAQVSALIQDLSPKQQSQITLMTDFSEAQKPALLAASDIFVLPSEAESFGIAFVEAWACRRPVIGARMGAVASLIDEEKDGLLFTCGDVGDLARAISTLLAAPQQRTQMGEAGFQKVLANYTWDIVVERTRSVYQSVIVHHNE